MSTLTQPLLRSPASKETNAEVDNDAMIGSWYFLLGESYFKYQIIKSKSSGELYFRDNHNHTKLRTDANGFLVAQVVPVNNKSGQLRMIRLQHSEGEMISNLSCDADGTQWGPPIKARKSVFETEPLRGLPDKDLFGVHAVDPHIKQLLDQANAVGAKVPMTVAAAPAVGMAQMGMVYMLVFYIAFVPSVMYVQSCPSPDTYEVSVGVAEEAIQTPLMFSVPVYIVFVGIYLLLEWRCISYIVATQVKELGNFRFLGGIVLLSVHAASYNFFKVYCIFFSFLGHVGIVSNGLFVARITKAQYCDSQMGSGGMLEKFWQHTLEQSSFFRMLPDAFVHSLSIRNLVLLAWALKALQFSHAICWAFPIGESEKGSRSFKVIEAAKALFHFLFVQCCGWRRSRAFQVDYVLPPEFQVSGKFVYVYKTLLNNEQNHGAALQVIADVIKFVAVRSLDFRFAVAKMKGLSVGIRRASVATEESSRTMSTHDQGKLYLAHAQNQMAHAISGLLFIGIFESMLLLHLQISLIGLHMNLPTNWKATEPEISLTTAQAPATNGKDVLLTPSFLLIIVNLILSLLKFSDALGVIKVFREVTRHYYQWRDNESLNKNSEKLYGKIWWLFIRYLFYVLGYMFLLWLAFAKVWAIFYCPCKLWNLAGGCASLKDTGALCDVTS